MAWRYVERVRIWRASACSMFDFGRERLEVGRDLRTASHQPGRAVFCRTGYVVAEIASSFDIFKIIRSESCN